ncbi:iron-sulfur cluster-binding protein [Deferribacter desulfuricans SSM1]|uniref:Iron-sulfur cluster-binding protein n=1 Tax=Deferribacter desulfuricans (strain DSM 14783 / JCM 11476 / NBRC 101012 / SSM1) TaxID=639282 RepID=D3P8V3_DEFDS|nr:P-loop NTPase [Deferribacter desulfuricans]BAI81143.1 iron-sulfur cluster-binding protein [Deferribacter desulfuricans SSM1]
MKEIVVISGKGGAGKSTITAGLAYFLSQKDIVVDADVDAADMHILLEPKILKKDKFYSGLRFEINQERCVKCNRCYEVCEFDAVNFDGDTYLIDKLSCEGCGFCSYECKAEAINSYEKLTGEKYISITRFGNKMVHARLFVGEENSGKLIAEIKAEAKKIAEKEGSEIILVDGPPGIGCNAISSLTNTNTAILVAESTESGFHDIKRCWELVSYFKCKVGLIINKFGLNPEIDCKIIDYFSDKNVEYIGKIDYSKVVVEALKSKKVLPEYDHYYVKVFGEFFDKIMAM